MNISEKEYHALTQKFDRALHIPIKTDLVLFDEYNQDVEVEKIYFLFERLAIEWRNSAKDCYPQLVVPFNEGERDKILYKVNRFINKMVLDTGLKISPTAFNTNMPASGGSACLPFKMANIELPFQYLEKFVCPKSKKGWLCLAYFSEAVNSESEYYSYLNFYNCSLFRFVDTEKSKKPDYKKYNKWALNKLRNTKKYDFSKWLSKYLHPGYHLRMLRDKIGHVEKLYNYNNLPSSQPDNLDDYKEIIESIPVVKYLAEEAVKNYCKSRWKNRQGR